MAAGSPRVSVSQLLRWSTTLPHSSRQGASLITQEATEAARLGDTVSLRPGRARTLLPYTSPAICATAGTIPLPLTFAPYSGSLVMRHGVRVVLHAACQLTSHPIDSFLTIVPLSSRTQMLLEQSRGKVRGALGATSSHSLLLTSVSHTQTPPAVSDANMNLPPFQTL